MLSATRHIALLRGVNVGGKHKVPMSELRGLCEELGWVGARTLLQTGNIVFDAAVESTPARLESDLEEAIETRFGFSFPVIVRHPSDVEAAVRALPMAGDIEENPSRVLLYLSKKVANKAAEEELRARADSGERVALVAGGLWVCFPNGVARSKLTPAAIDKAMGSVTTGRNWNTVLKIRRLVTSGCDVG